MTNATTTLAGLLLPPFLVQAGTHAIGTVRQIIRPAGTLAGVESHEITLRSRKKGEVYVLPSGERLLVTDQASCPRLADIDGVLSRHSDGKLYWLSHSCFDEFKRNVDEGRVAERRSANNDRWVDTLRYRAEVVDD